MAGIAPRLPFDLPRTRTRRVMMHVVDAGSGYIRFECHGCGYDTGWIVDTKTISENRRGMPCPVCNPVAIGEAR